jgi:hypothetical protein
MVPDRSSSGEHVVARFRSGADHAQRFYRLSIAAFTFAASSGVISVTP